jgi:hypothetical protein
MPRRLGIRFQRNPDRRHLLRTATYDDVLIEVRGAAKDQIAGGRVVRKSLSQVLQYPNATRVLRHAKVQNLPPVMRDYKEAVEHAKRKRRHGEEVHRSNRFSVISQERRPPLCRLRAAFLIQRSTIRSERSKPSIFNSPWMRGAPQVGFSAAMRKISSRSSLLTHFLSAHFRCRESHVQYSVNPGLLRHAKPYPRTRFRVAFGSLCARQSCRGTQWYSGPSS